MLTPEQAQERMMGITGSKPKRLKKPLPPPALHPYRAVVLGVDPGDCSGWSIWVKGVYLQSGELDVYDPEALDKVIAGAVEFAVISDLPIVMVLERPWSRRALGQSRKLWQDAWHRGGCSARRIARAWPSRWRAQLLGIGGQMKREGIRAHEQAHACRVTDRTEIPHDEAAGICLGHYGTHCGEVGKVLPRSARG